MRQSEIANVAIAYHLDRIREMVASGTDSMIDMAKIECVTFVGSVNELKRRGIVSETYADSVLRIISKTASTLGVTLY